MSYPQIYTINNVEYFISNDVYLYNPEFFIKINDTRNIREIVKYHNVPDTCYIYAYIKKNEWIISTKNYKLAKLLITTEWTNNNVPKFILYNKINTLEYNISNEEVINEVKYNDDVITNEVNNEVKYNDDVINEVKYNDVKNDVSNNNESIQNEINALYEYLPAPDIINLQEHELFRDKNGISYNIEMIGQRHPKQCYFNIHHISEIFELPKLYDNIIDKNTSYYEQLHYIYFIHKKAHNLGKKVNKINNKKYENKKTKKLLYLTYIGLITVLFTSRTGRARDFQDWTINILFTYQFGTNEQRQQLSADILRINVKTLRSILDKSSSPIICIYLFKLGTCEDLRQTMNIPLSYDDNLIVCKYGYTNDLSRRANEHNDEYGKQYDALIELILYTPIDKTYIAEAETILKTYITQ